MRRYFTLKKNFKQFISVIVCITLLFPINSFHPKTGMILTNETVIYANNSSFFFDNVENGTNGWTTSGTPASNETFGWHIISWDSKSPDHAWWCGNDATNLTDNNWNLSLVSPLFDLTTAYYVNFSIWHRYRLDSYYDYGYVEININGSSVWTPIFAFTGYQTSWITNKSDISAYAGEYIYIRFRFESDIVSIDSGWYIDDIELEVQGNFYAPTLADANVTPTTGNTSTLFTYWVNYTDADNNAPTSVNVVIDEIVHPMTKYDLSDTNYTDGCLYNYTTYLANISHAYYFTASDGNYTARDPGVGNYSGPVVNFANLLPPTLEGGVVTPYEGRADIFSFNVTYLDPENQAPSYINVTVNGTAHAMSPVNPSDTVYTDGAVFSYATTLPTDGVYVFHFNASDGDFEVGAPSAGELVGPYTWLYDMGGISWSGTLNNETNPSDSYKRLVGLGEEEKWLCVAVRPLSGKLVDVEMFGNFSTFLMRATASDNRANLFIYNTSMDPYEEYYIRAYIRDGTGSYRIEADRNPTLPAVYNILDENFTDGFTPNEILDVRKFGGHEPGRTYNLTVNVPSGVDLDVYIFNQTGLREDAVASSRNIGAGVAETTLFQLPTADNFTIVFVNENGVEGTYLYSITTDDSAPIATIDSPQNESYNTQLINVDLSCSAPDLDTMWYRVRNETDWIMGNTTWEVGAQLSLKDGSYTLYAWANDTEGNIQDPPSQVNFTVDTVPPTAVIDSPLATVYSINEVFINLSSVDTDVAAYWYRTYNRTGVQWLDSSNVRWTGDTLRAFPEGYYSLFAWANDTAGNIQNVTVAVNFTINAPPVVSIVAPENKTYANNNLTIDLATGATDIHMLWYRVANSTGWIAGNTTWYAGIYELLADGEYALYAWGNDTIGQVAPTVSINFSIDTTPPDLTIESPQSAVYTVETILINLSSPDPQVNSYWYRLRNDTSGSWIDLSDVPWTGPTVRALTVGEFTIQAWANDTVGNVQSANISFIIDTPPTIAIDFPLNQTYATSMIAINLSSPAPDIHTRWYRIWNGTTWITTNTTWAPGASETLDEGIYTLFAWGNDTLGLVSPTRNVKFTIDTTAPAVSIAAPLSEVFYSASILINVTSTAVDLDELWYRLYDRSSGTWLDAVDVPWDTPIQRQLPDGEYGLFVWANDTFGNVLEVPENVNFTVDAPPPIAYISVMNNTTYTSAILLNLTVVVPDLDRIWYALFDGAAWVIGNTTWTEPVTLELGDGNYTLYIWANDTQGNTSFTMVSFTVRLPDGGKDNLWIWLIILIIGVVSAVAMFYRYRKSRSKKRKPKTEAQKAAQTFAERVKPVN